MLCGLRSVNAARIILRLVLVVLPLVGKLHSFLQLLPLGALRSRCRGGFATPPGRAGASARCPAPATFAGIPRFAGFSSPAVPIPANTQCPRYSPVPLAIFHGFQFAFPWNAHLDKEIGVCQAKGITGFNTFLLPRGDKRVPFPTEENGIC